MFTYGNTFRLIGIKLKMPLNTIGYAYVNQWLKTCDRWGYKCDIISVSYIILFQFTDRYSVIRLAQFIKKVVNKYIK